MTLAETILGWPSVVRSCRTWQEILTIWRTGRFPLANDETLEANPRHRRWDDVHVDLDRLDTRYVLDGRPAGLAHEVGRRNAPQMGDSAAHDDVHLLGLGPAAALAGGIDLPAQLIVAPECRMGSASYGAE